MLTKCNECGSSVSDKAKACPHCGSPINTPLAYALRLVKTYQSSPKAQRAIHYYTLPYMRMGLQITAALGFVVFVFSLLCWFVSGFSDDDAIMAIIISIPLYILSVFILHLIRVRKINPHMRWGEFLQTSLQRVQILQGKYPLRNRSYKIITVPEYGTITSEQLHRAMMDVIIIKNATAEWNGDHLPRPEFDEHFIYDRDIAPYVKHLLDYKSVPLPDFVKDNDSLYTYLTHQLNLFREYESLEYEVQDKVLVDEKEYNRRMNNVLSFGSSQ